MTIKEMLIERLVVTSMDIGRLRAEWSADHAEKEELRKEVAKLNHEKAELAKTMKHLTERYEGELDAAEDMLVRMEEERDDLAFRLEDSMRGLEAELDAAEDALVRMAEEKNDLAFRLEESSGQ